MRSGTSCTVVAEFVPDIEAHTVHMLVHRVDDVRHQHDELRTQEPGRERVEAAVAVQDIGALPVLHAEPVAAGGELCMQIGKLCFRQLDAIALDVGDECRLRKQVEHEAEGQHDQRDAERANDQPQPDQQQVGVYASQACPLNSPAPESQNPRLGNLT